MECTDADGGISADMIDLFYRKLADFYQVFIRFGLDLLVFDLKVSTTASFGGHNT